MKISKSLVASFLFFSAYGQAQTDIAVTDITISSDAQNQVPRGIHSGVEITIANHGPGNMDAGTAIEASISYDLFSIQHTFELENSLVVGADLNLSFGENSLVVIDTSWDSIALVAHIHSQADSIDSNNTFLEKFYTSASINNDWSGAEVRILAPTNLDNFDIDNGTNIPPPLSRIEVDLINNGDVNYVAYSQIDYSLSLGDDSKFVSTNVGANGISSGETSTRLITNRAILPTMPSSAATHELCIRTVAAQDLAMDNDESCVSFTIADNYDPNDPNNWPWAVEDVNETERTKLFYVQGKIQIETEILNYTLMVFDLSGKLLQMAKGNGNTELDLSHYEHGIYFARVVDINNSELAAQKFIVLN